MDYQALAQLLGNYGEFLGSIAVFATLAYLAGQVRQTKAQMTRASQADRAALGLALMSSISDSNYVAPILAQIGRWQWSDFGLDNQEDTIRFNMWLYGWWRTEELNFRANDDQQLATQQQLIKAFLSAYGTPFWPDNRALFDADFVAVVDRLYSEVTSETPSQESLQSQRQLR